MEPNLSKAITDCSMITNDVTRLLTPSERARGRLVFLAGLNPLSETLPGSDLGLFLLVKLDLPIYFGDPLFSGPERTLGFL